jgi:hypothetical protein
MFINKIIYSVTKIDSKHTKILKWKSRPALRQAGALTTYLRLTQHEKRVAKQFRISLSVVLWQVDQFPGSEFPLILGGDF